MADAEAKAKAEKLAAAKKRVEQLKKQKAKKSGNKGEDKEKPAAEPKQDDQEDKSLVGDVPEEESEPPQAQDTKVDETPKVEAAPSSATVDVSTRDRSLSISTQSKLRSESFKQGGALSPGSEFPEGSSAPEIYRKQAARIDELEKENKRLAKETADGEKRWRKAEEELEDFREAEASRPSSKAGPAGSVSEEVEKLQAEIAALQRQNDQLQAQSLRPIRHGSSPSVATLGTNELTAQLASKSSTIESMEIDISNLKAQLARVASGSSAEQEQITALEDKLARTQKSLDTTQHELSDLKKNLDRTTEKAVKEGSERISAETKLKTLTRESEEAKAQTEEQGKKIEALEKKITTLTTLHKEHDARFQTLKREREKVDKDAADLRAKLGSLENENLRMKEAHERSRKRDAVGADDDGVDELENEERQKLESKVRQLEAEISDLRRGIWKDKRSQIDGRHSDLASPDSKFQEIDLHGGSPTRRRSVAPGKGFGDYFASTVNAFIPQVQGPEADELLEDDDIDFDEEAFARAQEEEQKRRIERVKEIKRGLNEWKGWRLDITETRRNGGEGNGIIFEI